MKVLLRILWAIAIILFLAAASLVAYDYWQTHNAFPPGSYIAGIDVSLLTPGDAAKKIKLIPLAKLYAPLITLEAESKAFTFPPEKLGILVLYDETVDRAFTLTHKGNYFDQLQFRINNSTTNSPLILEINDRQLQAVLESLAEEIRTTPRDATMSLQEKTGGYNIGSDDPGRELNIKRSMVRFKVRIYNGETTIPLIIDYTLPKVTEKELRSNPPINYLSGYTTYYGKHDDPNRIHNIKLVASWIDGTLMMPGDIISVAEILGDVTEEQGFKEALVIIKDELVPQLGGGSCQIATTLFNAATLSDLKILQRRNHSFYFNIYPLGRDAAVYPGTVDLEIENDTEKPVLIKAEATDKKLTVRLYGTRTGKKVKFSDLKVFGKDMEKNEYKPMALKEIIEKDVPFKTEVTRAVFDKLGPRSPGLSLTSWAEN
jgi:vancomycin resistance protein YoaR